MSNTISTPQFRKDIILNPTEGYIQDRKAQIYPIEASKEELAEYIKDLIALANSARTRGFDTYLIFGVNNQERKIIGIDGQDIKIPVRYESFATLEEGEIERIQIEMNKRPYPGISNLDRAVDHVLGKFEDLALKVNKNGRVQIGDVDPKFFDWCRLMHIFCVDNTPSGNYISFDSNLLRDFFLARQIMKASGGSISKRVVQLLSTWV
jgi:hypothetical protein